MSATLPTHVPRRGGLRILYFPTCQALGCSRVCCKAFLDRRLLRYSLTPSSKPSLPRHIAHLARWRLHAFCWGGNYWNQQQLDARSFPGCIVQYFPFFLVVLEKPSSGTYFSIRMRWVRRPLFHSAFCMRRILPPIRFYGAVSAST